MASVLFLTALLLAVTTVKATIDGTPSATLACTPTGFSPTFTFSEEVGETIGFEVHIGTVSVASGAPCNAEITSVDSTTPGTAGADTITIAQLNSGTEIPYLDATPAPSCQGTFDNAADGNTIDYKTNVDIVVTETIRSTIKRQKRFNFELKCHLTRDVNQNTATQNWQVDATLTETAGGVDKATAFTFPVDFDFYTDNGRGTVQSSSPFTVTQGTNLWIRLKEATDNSLFKFTTERCWATPDSSPTHATQDVFFNAECPVDQTVTFVDKTDASPNFDLNIKAFFFSGEQSTAIYFHCDIFICKQDDTSTVNCVQNLNAACTAVSQARKRRDVATGGPVETRRLSSKQYVLLPETEIVVPECPANSVYDRENKKCSSNNVVQVKGVYLDLPWNQDLANTSSKAFKNFALEKEYQLYALLQLSDDADNILGVKVVGARQGSVVLDVQIVYKSTIDSSQAFDTFKKAIQDPAPTSRASRIINILNVKREKVIELVEVAPRQAVGDVDKMTLIVLVVVLAAVVFIAGVVALKVRQVRRAPAATATFGAPQVKSFDNPTLETVS